MKKYLKLTSQEAIQYFMHKDGTLAPETAEEIRQKLNDLTSLKSDLSVSLVMPTHRIFPDTDNDKVLLKNLIIEAENKLKPLVDKRVLKTIMENIEEANEAIDHRLNLDSLVLFANEHFSSVVKLPITQQQEVMIDPNFDIRPLYKSKQQNQRYYIFTISRQKIRLLEAFNDKIIEEIENEDFPFENTEYYTTDPIKLKQDIFEENLIKEFFNVSDKRFRKYLISNPLPVILAGDVKSVSFYKEKMDNSKNVIAYVNGNFDNAPSHEIIQAVYPVIKQFAENKQEEYFTEINVAKSNSLLVNDVNEILAFSEAGNAQTLYIGDNYSLKAFIDKNTLEISKKSHNGDDKQQEIVLVLINNVKKSGGNIVFLEDNLLAEYRGIVLVKRF